MPATFKQTAVELIERLRDNASVEGVVAPLGPHWKVDEGLRQLDRGEGIPHAEATPVVREKPFERSAHEVHPSGNPRDAHGFGLLHRRQQWRYERSVYTRGALS